MSSFFDEIAAKLAQLSGVATPEVSRDELNEFNVRDIQAVRVSEGGGGGGGNVPFVGNDPPASPTDGMLWWDPDDDTDVDGSQTDYRVRFPLSAAQFIAVTGGTPLEVVAAPGAGLAIVPQKLSVAFLAGDTAYTSDFDANAVLHIDYEGQSVGLVSATVASVTMATDDTFSFGSSSDETPFLLSVAEDAALFLRGENAQADGNGTLILTIHYVLASVV